MPLFKGSLFTTRRSSPILKTDSYILGGIRMLQQDNQGNLSIYRKQQIKFYLQNPTNYLLLEDTLC